MLRKRIPTLLGIVLLLVGITAGVYLVELGPQPLTTRATPEVIPSPSTSDSLGSLPTPAPVGTESGFGLTELPSAVEPVAPVTIDSPGEGEAVNTQQPEFFGEGPAGTRLTITLESEHQIQTSVTVNQGGGWSWAPNTALEPGEHFLTLRWVDAQGVSRSIRRRFVVYAQGESSLPAFEATPSAITPTPTPIQLAQVTPTPTPIPDLTPGPSPTPIPSPTGVAPTAVATEPAIPVPGTGSLTLWAGLVGSGLIVSGMFLRRFERG